MDHVNEGTSWSNWRYRLAEREENDAIGDSIAGKLTRQQLLHIPEETLRHIEKMNRLNQTTHQRR